MSMLRLTDDELAVLDGQCLPETQAKVDAAKARIAARAEHADLPPALAGFVADVKREAETNGRLVWQSVQVRHCTLCGKYAGHLEFRSGPRKGRPNYDKPKYLRGYELARRFVVHTGYPTLGGCKDCVEKAVPVIRDALRGVNAQVPERLRHPDEPKRVHHENRRCTKCDWTGHEGQMGRRRTLMGDGTYPAVCPSCGAENVFLSTLIEKAEGFTVVSA